MATRCEHRIGEQDRSTLICKDGKHEKRSRNGKYSGIGERIGNACVNLCCFLFLYICIIEIYVCRYVYAVSHISIPTSTVYTRNLWKVKRLKVGYK